MTRGRHAARHAARASRPAGLILLLAGLLVALGGGVGLALNLHSGRPGVPEGNVPHVAVPAGRTAALASSAAGQHVPRPLYLVVPAIGVRTRLIRLGTTSTGAVQVPSSTSVAGWYTASARPGAIGPAVILGHVDSYHKRGVFFRLRWLHRGDKVFVTRADGSVAKFVITKVADYLKTAFPSKAVYGAVPYSAIRLITCGGTFDSATGHYLSNVVAYGRQIVTGRHPSRRAGR
ncbi:MAG TPA: sortase [Streptosporangiaceae bacterium]